MTRIARCFMNMQKKIVNRNQELKNLNLDLEKIVNKRTNQLVLLNYQILFK
jgi:hypothetical protein